MSDMPNAFPCHMLFLREKRIKKLGIMEGEENKSIFPLWETIALMIYTLLVHITCNITSSKRKYTLLYQTRKMLESRNSFIELFDRFVTGVVKQTVLCSPPPYSELWISLICWKIRLFLISKDEMEYLTQNFGFNFPIYLINNFNFEMA